MDRQRVALGEEFDEEVERARLEKSISQSRIERMLSEIITGYDENGGESGRGGRGKVLMCARVLQRNGVVALHNRGKSYLVFKLGDDPAVYREVATEDLQQRLGVVFQDSTTGYALVLPKAEFPSIFQS